MDLSKMKKIFAPYIFAAMTAISGAVHAANVDLDVPAGFTGGSAHDFTFGDTWQNLGTSPWAFMDFYNGMTNTLIYEKGSFTFDSMSLNARPWDGYNDNIPDQPNSHQLLVSFLDIDGKIITNGQIELISGDTFQQLSMHVEGVHAIYFNTPTAVQLFPRLRSIDLQPSSPVPEAPTYAMLLAGLAAVSWAARRRA